tara:strand:+ start:9762 stop:10571 length:810 start_codon:yes stop_codon:yes gene_type:complete
LSELKTRVLIAIPLAILVLGITWLGGLFFELLFGAIALITIWEVHRLLKMAGSEGFFYLSILIAATIWNAPLLPYYVVSTLAIIILLISVGTVIGTKNNFKERWFSTLFTGIYAPVGFLMMVHIRNLGIESEGLWLTLTLFLMIWGNDIFAYFGGKTFGKRPLAPKISPKKTWEGFWWGFAGSAVGFLIVFLLANPYPLSIWSIVPAVLIISIMGPLGDITASSLKRRANVKDSSSILPGHGGFFDRFDSLILSAPFLFFFFFYMLRIY